MTIPIFNLLDTAIGDRQLSGTQIAELLAQSASAPNIGNVTGTFNGNLTGNVTGNVVGNVTGNITGVTTRPTSAPVAAGSVIGNATALASGVNFVTGADGTKGVQLPAGVAGQTVTIINTSAASALILYPPTSGTLNNHSANVSVSMGNNTSCDAIAQSASAYWLVPEVPS